jgi:hypothetical protein
MSRITASSRMSQMAMMPMTEAAGPDRMDWTGESLEADRGMVPPSA